MSKLTYTSLEEIEQVTLPVYLDVLYTLNVS